MKSLYQKLKPEDNHRHEAIDDVLNKLTGY